MRHFAVKESEDRFAVALRSEDGETRMSVRGSRTDRLPPSSVFQSLAEASDYLEGGSLGYSATGDLSHFQGLELCCRHWAIEPLEVEEAHSSYFEDRSLFPKGSIELDCALLMRGIEHEWHGLSDLCCAERHSGKELSAITNAASN